MKKYIFLLLTCLSVLLQGQTPKKIVIDGGAAPTNGSQLINDLNWISRAELIDTAAAIDARINPYSWLYDADIGSATNAPSGGTILFSGGVGLSTEITDTGIRIDLSTNEFSAMPAGQIDNTDQLLILQGGGILRATVGDFESQLPKIFNVFADSTDSFVAPFSIGEFYTWTGTGGINTRWNNANKTLSFDFDPIGNLSSRVALSSDKLITFSDTDIGYTTISDIITSSTYSWNATGDDNVLNSIVNNETFDFRGGTGLTTDMGFGGITFNLNTHTLSEQTPTGTDFLLWFDGAGSEYRRVQVSNLPVTGGSTGDVTNVTGGLGLKDDGSSGNITLDLDLSGITENFGTAPGDSWVPVLDAGNSFAHRRVVFSDLLQGTLVAGTGITIDYPTGDETVTISASGGSSFSGNFTDLNFTNTTGFSDAVDNGFSGYNNTPNSGIDFTGVQGGDFTAYLDIFELDYTDEIQPTDKIALWSQRDVNDNAQAAERETSIREMLLDVLVAKDGISIFQDGNTGRVAIQGASSSGDITEVKTSNEPYLTGGTLSGVADLRFNQTLYEDDLRNYGFVFSNTSHTNLFSSGQRVAHISITAGNTATVLPDPDTAPDGAIIYIVVENGSTPSTSNPTIEVIGSERDIYVCNRELNLCSAVASTGLFSGFYTLVKMYDPEVTNSSNYVWAFNEK